LYENGYWASKWEARFKIVLEKMGREVVDWIHLAHERDKYRARMNTVMILLVI
jgi:hypothetical protein